MPSGIVDARSPCVATWNNGPLAQISAHHSQQLALFTRLHGLAGGSAWVGDLKQCIFEWNGADPALVDEVLAAIRARGGSVEHLTVNRRSRPELVALSSELSASAFADGINPADVRATAYREDPTELAALPPLGLGFYPARDPFGLVMAELVAGLLANTSATSVLDRATKVVRPVVAGDIAVLVATNAECRAVACALERLGIRAATVCEGLLQTPDGRCAIAGLTLLVASDDALADAELEPLCGRDGDEDEVLAGRDAWVAEQLAAVACSAMRASLAASHRAFASGTGSGRRYMASSRATVAAMKPGYARALRAGLRATMWSRTSRATLC